MWRTTLALTASLFLCAAAEPESPAGPETGTEAVILADADKLDALRKSESTETRLNLRDTITPASPFRCEADRILLDAGEGKTLNLDACTCGAEACSANRLALAEVWRLDSKKRRKLLLASFTDDPAGAGLEAAANLAKLGRRWTRDLSDEAFVTAIEALVKAFHFDTALAALADAETAGRKYSDADGCKITYLRGKALYRKRKWKSSTKVLEEGRDRYCAEGDPSGAKVAMALGRALLRRGHITNGGKAMRKLLELPTVGTLGDDALYAVGEAWRGHGNRAKAIPFYDEAAKTFPKGDMAAECLWAAAG